MTDIDLRRYLQITWRWLWLILLLIGISAALGYQATQMMPKTYLSAITLMVGDEAANRRVNLDDITLSQRMAEIYAGMATRQIVLEATVKALRLPTDWRELQSRVLASHAQESQFLSIRVTDTDPLQAKATAEEIARQLVLQSPTADNAREIEARRQFVKTQLDVLQSNLQQAETTLARRQSALVRESSARGVLDLQDEIKALELKIDNFRTTYATLLTSYEGKSANSLTIVEPAFVPSAPVSPNEQANVLMAAVLGLLIGLAVIVLIETLMSSKRLENEDEIHGALGVPVIGSILRMRKGSAQSLVALRDADSAVAEAFRFLRTNIRFACPDEKSIAVAVTSPSVGEGKSTISANLAISFAQAGKRTILVDADLRHPSAHGLFGVPNEQGLGSLLQDRGETPAIEEFLVPTGVSGLWVLTAGPMPEEDTGKLFASEEMKRLLKRLETMAEVVIFDCPPVLPVVDTPILASLGPKVVIVVDGTATRPQAAVAASKILRQAGANLLGIVHNKAPKSPVQNYEYRAVKRIRLPQPPALRILPRA